MHREIKLTPSPDGEQCMANGSNAEIEIQCEECEYYLKCFPDWKKGGIMNKEPETIFIPIPTQEEIRAEMKRQNELLAWAQSLTPDQINYLCDGGWYNNTIKGYLITAAWNAEFTEKQVNKLLCGLNWAFSEKNKVDAEKVYNDR